MENLTTSAEKKPKGIEGCIFIIGRRGGRGWGGDKGGIGKFLQQVGSNQDHRTKLEVVAKGTSLIVNNGVTLCLTCLFLIVVGVNHYSSCIVGCTKHSLNSILTHQKRGRFRYEQGVSCLGFPCNFSECLTA